MALPSHHRTDFLLSVGHAPLPSPQDTLRDSPICNIHLFASSLQHLTSLLRCLLPLALHFEIRAPIPFDQDSTYRLFYAFPAPRDPKSADVSSFHLEF